MINKCAIILCYKNEAKIEYSKLRNCVAQPLETSRPPSLVLRDFEKLLKKIINEELSTDDVHKVTPSVATKKLICVMNICRIFLSNIFLSPGLKTDLAD